MPIVIGDTIEGDVSRTADEGYRTTRGYTVAGLEGIAASEVQYRALQAPKLPALGDRHPSIPSIVARTFTVRPIDKNTCQVLVGYELPPGTTRSVSKSGLDEKTRRKGVVRTGSRLREIEAFTDRFGQPLTTEHRYVTTNADGSTLRDETVTQLAKVTVAYPETVVTVTRLERGDPDKWSYHYLGKRNLAPFHRRPSGAWLMTAIEGQTEDGVNYDVFYELTASSGPDGWDSRIYFIDPETDRPIDGAQFGTEIKVYEHYDYANFSALRLPL